MRAILSACQGRAGLLVAALAVSVVTAGCTTSSGGALPARPSTAAVPVTPQARSLACSAAEINASIAGFFTAWNHHDAVALGRLFTADGVLDMATKHQDTLHQREWASTGGLGARRLIAAFAEHQWAAGERLLYREVSGFTGPGTAGSGGGAVVVASFPDGTTQPMVETKFAYDCAARAFAHVVIISAMAARHNARPWSWRMP